jgi:hypothetical protein
LLKLYRLKKLKSEWHCDEELSRQSGGLRYSEMVQLADKANFRHALWEMGEAIVTLFEQIVERSSCLQNRPATSGPTWNDVTARWRTHP